jgi:3-hydroxyacyl-[acyl-carrier-protein] dehydratase
MRFLFYDRVSSLDKGRRIVGTKTFALSEDYLQCHFSREPLVPGVILLEAMAQLLGWAIIHAHEFRLSAIVSLVEGLTITSVRLRPGFQATISGEIISTSASDSLGRAWLEVEGARLASADRIIFSHFPVENAEALRELFRYCSGLDRRQFEARGRRE